MTRNAKASLVFAATIAAASVAAALVSTSAYAEGPIEIKTPLIGGDAWSPGYNMPAPTSAVSREQVRGAYKMSREEVKAMTSEDSGSAYLASQPMKIKGAATMGGPGIEPSKIEAGR